MKPSTLSDEFLTVKFNQEYYAQRLSKTKRKNRLFDLYLALFAGGSGVTAFGIWDLQIGTLEAGKLIFGILASIGVIIGILKPYLKLDDEIERLSSVEGAYSILAHLLQDMVSEASANDHKSGINEENFSMARAVRGSLEAKEDKPVDEALAKHCQTLIRQRFADKVSTLDNLKQNRL